LDCGGNPAEREPRRFGSSILSRKAVSPLRSATVQNFRNWSLIGFSELNFTSDLCASASLRLCVKTALAESGQNGSLPFFRSPAYFNPMTRKATGLLPGLGQTAVRLNS
jgi:hypothetical protein